MSFNVNYIFPGDDKNQILSKVNYNFAQIFFNGVGEKGSIGPIGPTGIIGEVGRDGEIGATGNRAVNWYFSTTEPAAANSRINDIWVNVGATGVQNVYVYDGSDWVFSGETILGDSTFGLLTSIEGPGGSTTHNAIDISDPTPSDVTFVLSDETSSTGSVNPNLAKFLIATDPSQNPYPIIGLDKTFVGSTVIPSFSWGSTGDNYDLVFENSSNTVINSGNAASISATGGTATFSSAGLFTVQSNAQINFTNATGASAAMTFSTGNLITFSSQNKVLSANSLTYQNLTLTAGITANAANLLQSSSPGNGILVQSDNPGGTGNTGAAVTTFLNSSGYKILESRTNSFNVVGESGPSGSASGRIIKAVQRAANVSASATFARGGFNNNYLPLSISDSNSDIIYIVPKYSNASTIYANGSQYRVYLQLTGFTNTFNFTRNEGRVFDFFLEDDTLSFGGLRTVFSGGSSVVQLFDFSNSATGGCRHIRVTQVNPSTAFYYFLTPRLSPTRCGYIQLNNIDVAVGPGQSL